jgi:Restriction endonuclease
MERPQVTGTAHRLPFDELEPHRFEDLVRELLQRWRAMSEVQAIGRSGDEQGVDIRAYEEVLGGDARLWYVQVKRTGAIGPKKVGEIAIAAVPDGADPPWGFILAAPVNFSRASQNKAKAVLTGRGVSDVRLWGRSELEDLLYQPANENLLNKYFSLTGSGNDAERRDLYRRWLRFAENWATWAYDDNDVPRFLTQLHDLMADIDLVAPESVKFAVQGYINNLGSALAAIEREVDRAAPESEQAMAAGLAYAHVMRSYREAVIRAMRDDVGPF